MGTSRVDDDVERDLGGMETSWVKDVDDDGERNGMENLVGGGWQTAGGSRASRRGGAACGEELAVGGGSADCRSQD